jgi:hypothetical protein
LFFPPNIFILNEGENAVAEIPKDGFKDWESLQGWMSSLGKRNSRYIGAIAVRSAHRAAPFLDYLLPSDPPSSFAENIMLSALRCNLTARVSAKYPERKITAAAFAASEVNSSRIDVAIPSSAAAIFAAAAEGCLDTNVYHYAASACHSAAATGETKEETSAFFDAITQDARQLERGMSVLNLLNQPLWDQPPDFWQFAKESFQLQLSHLYASEDAESFAQIWYPWKTWFDSVFDGQPAFNLPEPIAKELEIRIALGGGQENFWKGSAELVNSKISEWLDEARKKAKLPFDAKPLVQNPYATTFGTNSQGQIDHLPIPTEQRLLDTPQQRRAYIDIRNDCISILSQGANQLGACEVQFKTLREVMPEDFSQAAVYDLWRAVNRLRRTHNAHKSVAANIDPHPAKLEPSIAVELEGFLSEVNNFAFADPKIRERDINAIPPQDRVKLDVERALGDQLAKNALAHEGLTTQPAHQSLKDEEENAAGAHDDEHGVQAKEQSNIVRRNFLSAAIMGTIAALKSESGFAFREFRGGAYKQAGGAAMIAVGAFVFAEYPAVVQYVVGNIGPLIDYAAIYNNPGVVEFLNWLKAQIRK